MKLFIYVVAGIIVAVISLCSGCVGIRHQTGLQKTINEPLHTESGIGATIWKIPIVGLGFWGLGANSQVPSVIVHRYDYQAQPPALAPSTPPSPPTTGPSPINYQTIYQSAWNDPSLVIFKNDSYRKVRIKIDGQKTVVLEPYGATSDLHLGIGDHPVRITIEKPTAAHSTWEVIQFFSIYIRPEGRSQIFHIYDY